MIEQLKTHIKNQDTDSLLSLLKENPEILDLKDTHGSSGFMMLAYSGLKKAFDLSIDLKKTFSFHEAIVCGKIEMVKNYMEQSRSNGVNVHSADGFTPLSLAAFFNQNAIAKLLITMGADPNLAAINASKVNALHAAVAKENHEICIVLLKNGVDVNAGQTQNVTALHSAVHRGNLALTQLLVEHGASIESEMDNGDTALHIATREGHKKIEAYLKENLCSNK